MGTLYERIRGDILAGDLGPGRQLVESWIADRYGVSRTPVREALLLLQHDGLVERRSAVMVVRERSPEEILEIYEARIALEGAAAAAAARRRTALDLARIKVAQEAMTAGPPEDAATAENLNEGYHHAVWNAAHNATLRDLLDRTDAQRARYSGTTLTYPGRWEEILREHAGITAAIERQDAGAAERLAREHLDRAREIRLDLFVRTGSASARG